MKEQMVVEEDFLTLLKNKLSSIEKGCERMDLLFSNKGQTLLSIEEEVCQRGMLLPSNKRRELLHTSKKRMKGADGKWMEWFILGRQGDNISHPDLECAEIKCVEMKRSRSKLVLKERGVRLVNINFNTIQVKSFEEFLQGKIAKLLIVQTTPAEYGKDKRLLDVGYIDCRPFLSFIAKEYEIIAEKCRNGEANLFNSSVKTAKKWDLSYLFTYSQGDGENIHIYKDKLGQEHKVKGRALRLQPNKFTELYTSLTWDF